MSEFGSYILSARRTAGMTQASVALAIGKSKAMVVAIEQGRAFPAAIGDVVLLARAVKADPMRAMRLFLAAKVASTGPAPIEEDAFEPVVSAMARVVERRLERDRDEPNSDIVSAAPMSYATIEKRMDDALSRVISDEDYIDGYALPVTAIFSDRADALSRVVGLEVRLEIVDTDEWWEAATESHSGSDIVVKARRDVWERAVAGHGRDRFTLAHELAHVVLHSDLLAREGGAMFRDGMETAGETAHRLGVPVYRSPEWQAQAGAAAALMPLARLKLFAEESGGLSVAAVAETFRVSWTAAQYRLTRVAELLIGHSSPPVPQRQRLSAPKPRRPMLLRGALAGRPRPKS